VRPADGRLGFANVAPRVAGNPAVGGVARTLLLDAAAAEAVAALGAEGIRAILLKGPVTVQWLYSGQASRTYTDVDLLVAPDEFPRALRRLEDIGYRNYVEARDTVQGTHAVPLRLERPSGAGGTQLPAGLSIDLHWRFDGIGAPDEVFWAAIAQDAERMLVSGREVEVPSEPARALLLALHAGTFRASFRQPLTDLDRALERLPDDTWQAASRLAVRLDALPRFAAGLAVRPRGLELIDRLGLKGAVNVRAGLHTAGAPPAVADGLVRLRATRGVGPRVRLLVRALIPPRAALRLTHPRLARLGSLGLALAYVYRPIWLIAKLPAALRAYARARRTVRADDLGDDGDPGAAPQGRSGGSSDVQDPVDREDHPAGNEQSGRKTVPPPEDPPTRALGGPPSRQPGQQRD
jgi:Uncharacterised nucleotidyltransferase